MTPTDHWRRFALMDVMVLVLCCGLGMAVTRINQYIPAWQRFVSGLMLGLFLAVPALVLSQRWFRGRREQLGPGERLGMLASCGVIVTMAMTVLASTPLAPIALSVGFLCISLQVILGVIAAALLLVAWTKRKPAPSRPWTEWLGLIVSIVLAGMVIYPMVHR